jgi:hypothetical protein
MNGVYFVKILVSKIDCRLGITGPECLIEGFFKRKGAKTIKKEIKKG